MRPTVWCLVCWLWSAPTAADVIHTKTLRVLDDGQVLYTGTREQAIREFWNQRGGLATWCAVIRVQQTPPLVPGVTVAVQGIDAFDADGVRRWEVLMRPDGRVVATNVDAEAVAFWQAAADALWAFCEEPT